MDGAVQLLARVLGEVVESLEACRELTQGVGVELSVEGDAELALDPRDLVLEARPGHATNDVTEHLHEPPVGIPRKARVAGARRQPLRGGVAQAQVQDRVHHPRHRVARAAAHGDQQRVLRVPETLLGALLQARQRLRDGLRQAFWWASVRPHVFHARLGCDREPGWHEIRPEHARHLCDA